MKEEGRAKENNEIELTFRNPLSGIAACSLFNITCN